MKYQLIYIVGDEVLQKWFDELIDLMDYVMSNDVNVNETVIVRKYVEYEKMR